MDRHVLSRLSVDSEGLSLYYEGNKQNYRWEERLECVLISCQDQEVADKAMAVIRDADREDITRASLIASCCAPHYRAECIRLSEEIYESGDNALADEMNWKLGLSGINEREGRFEFIVKKKILPAGQKTLDEARGQVVSDYQEHLETELIKKLKKKYKVKVHRKLVSGI